MPLYSHKDKTLLLVHIPKTGGSSLEEMFVEAGAKQALKFHKRLGFSACTPQHMHWALLARWVPRNFYNFCFAIVRNPFDRIASEYAWRSRILKGKIPDFNTWVHETFDQYDEDPYIYDNHIRPQTEFVGQRVKVFKLENGLEPAAQFAFKKIGLPYARPAARHARKSKHNLITLHPSTLSMIINFYAADFSTFGYDRTTLPPDLFLLSDTPAATSLSENSTHTGKSFMQGFVGQIKRRLQAAINEVRR